MIEGKVSHFQVLEKLGEGGMGVVYKATDLNLGRTVALKFLPRQLTSDDTEKERFYHEGRAASTLNHPNITTIYEIQEADGQLFLAMEYVEGSTLKQLIAKQPLSVAAALDIAVQICSGLAAAHKKDVVHRDIKSDNILITPTGDVKITDFGLAKLKGATRITQVGSTLGTAAYMSPEQAQGEDLDARSDIFSCGVVIYELLTGKLPFRGDHQAALLYAVITEDPQPIARFNGKVSPEIERIVAKALAKDREARYQHVDEMLADLKNERKRLEQAAVVGAAVSGSRWRVPVAAAAPKKWMLRYLIPASILALLLILLVVFNPFNFQVSVLKSSAAEQDRSLAVLYFQDIPDPEDKDHTGDMLTDLLITSLSQDKALQVVSRERLYGLQKDLGQGEVRTITATVAQQLAERAGVSMMLLGSIVQREPALVITARVVNVKSGTIVSSQRLTGYASQQIFALVDTLALLVRNDLVPRTLRSSADEARSVAEVTTASPEAYRYYSEGLDKLRKFVLTDARVAFTRAIELDSNFAMAYFVVGAGSLTDNITSIEYFKKAWQLRGRVTEKERLRIEAYYLDGVEGKVGESAAVLESFIQKFPYEVQIYSDLSLLYSRLGRHDNALEILQRMMQKDSLYKDGWNDLAYAYACFSRKEDALRAADRYLELLPGEPNPYDTKGDILMAFGEVDSAVACYRKAVTLRPDFLSSDRLGYIALVDGRYGDAREHFRQLGATPDLVQRTTASLDGYLTLMHQGRLRSVRESLSGQLPQLRRKDLIGLYRDALNWLVLISMELQDPAATLQYAQAFNDLMKPALNSPGAGKDLLALALYRHGDAAGSTKLLEELGRDVEQKGLIGLRCRYEYAEALVAMDEGKFEQAVEHFKRGFEALVPNHAPQIAYGIALFKAGRVDEAVEELSHVTRWVPNSNLMMSLSFLPESAEWPIATVKAHYWLGVAYEQQGRKADAAREYRTFLDTWKDADFPSPQIRDARSRLARLS